MEKKIKPEEQYFRKTLLHWNDNHNHRQMPWKNETNPYKIWLSEIILQQTRVEQGWQYYLNFIAAFPTVQDLAAAKDEAVFKLWEGLGYYSRCRNLLATARIICSQYKGQFPNEYEKIIALKGIGPYTAAAIASFAFGLSHAVVDGNVYRVIARYYGITTPTDNNTGKKQFLELANRLIDPKRPGNYNQAIMDFGATVCKPALPVCETCPLAGKCVALKAGTIDKLPVKEKKLQIKNRNINFIVAIYQQKVYTCTRPAGDIWHNLNAFIEWETNTAIDTITAELQPQIATLIGTKSFKIVSISGIIKQTLTHQRISGRFITIHLNNPLREKQWYATPISRLSTLSFPKFIHTYLQENNVSLNLL
ncbi:MAG: A/G-specific adenine glycosylase [Bacteroidota bacterium]